MSNDRQQRLISDMRGVRYGEVLGIFARINYRDGKPRYLADTPRFVAYARAVARRYRPLAPLARLLDEMEGIAVRVGFTF